MGVIGTFAHSPRIRKLRRLRPHAPPSVLSLVMELELKLSTSTIKRLEVEKYMHLVHSLCLGLEGRANANVNEVSSY